MANLILRKPDGSFQMEPQSTVIETQDGVYISYDVDAGMDDYKFKQGYEVVGMLYGDIEEISDPEETWLSRMKEDRK